MDTIFKRWWVILLQGIILIIIGIVFFNNPEEVLAFISFWIGILTLGVGVIGLIAYFVGKSEGSFNNSLWWSVITLLLGLVMVARVGLTMKLITVIFGCWILLTGILLLSEGIKYRMSGLIGWIMITGGILSIFAAIAIIFDMYTGAVWISTLLGIQGVIAGIGFILLAIAKRNIVDKIKRHSFTS